jgi:hypothetical protein
MWVALTGILFLVVLIVSVVLAGEPPDPTEDSIEETVSFFEDDSDAQFAGGILFGLSAVFFLFFAGALRSVLRSAEGGTGPLSAVAFGGGIVAAVGMLLFGGLTFTLADAADELDPIATQTLNALNSDLFFPLAGGMATLLIATGIVAVRTAALPRWLAWAALVLGVASFTPIGFFAFLAALAWVLVVSIVLWLRSTTAPAAVA